MRVYVAGGMRGIENFNIPAFDNATKRLRDSGCEVFNPVEKDFERAGLGEDATLEEKVKACESTDIRGALALDLAWICEHADAVAFLPGWEESRGARAEYAAAVAIGLPLMFLHDLS